MHAGIGFPRALFILRIFAQTLLYLHFPYAATYFGDATAAYAGRGGLNIEQRAINRADARLYPIAGASNLFIHNRGI